MKLEYEFNDSKSGGEKQQESLRWLTEHIGPCQLQIGNGKKISKELVEALRTIFEIEFDSEVMKFVKFFKGSDWALVRWFDVERSTVSIRYWFGDDAQAVQFKLAMG